MDGQSLNITQDLIAKLKEIVPGAFTEDKLDIEQLKQLLGENINTDNERYQLNWAGKSEAYKELQSSIWATLVPLQESSINWDEANHIFIEGDNLEVLKVLQRSYYGKIKMIYIDPPYNTGNDSFIYPDKFTESKEEYFARIGKYDETGNLKRDLLFKKNNKENGQFHSNWLNMMLPRLFLARNLLSDEGVIFISIDDNEQANLKLLLDEIFGEENFIANMVRENKAGAGHDSGLIAIEYDYTLMYCKNKSKLNLNKKLLDVENDTKYKLVDAHLKARGKYYLRDLDYRGTYSQSGDYEIEFSNGKKVLPGGRFGPPNTWRWSKDKVNWGIENDFIVFDNSKGKVYIKQYQFVDNEGKPYQRQIPFRALTKFMNGKGSQEVDSILGTGIFSFPKSTEMIKYFLDMVVNNDSDIILDFFAGSGTTAHSVLEYNKEKEKQLRSISIQLPELTDLSSEAHKQGYTTISDISFKRISKVLENTNNSRKEELSFGTNKPEGIRKFSLSPSNFKIWRNDVFKTEDELRQAVNLFTSNVVAESPTYSILWELLIKNGAALTDNIKPYIINNLVLFYCTENKSKVFILTAIVKDTLPEILKIKPQSVIALDSSFSGNDALKTNFVLKMNDSGINFKSI